MFGEEYGGTFAGGNSKGADLQSTLRLSLEEAYSGGSKRIAIAGRGNLEVQVPRGVKEGSKIRLSGQGEKSPFGGPAGDLLLNVSLEKHPEFRLEGDNVESSLQISVSDAALGTEAKVRTLAGSYALKVPAGVQGGQKLKLKSLGWPKKGGGYGDHFAVVRISIPKNLTEEEKRIFEELRRLEATHKTAQV
jgi:curved DNA-binding protein